MRTYPFISNYLQSSGWELANLLLLQNRTLAFEQSLATSWLLFTY